MSSLRDPLKRNTPTAGGHWTAWRRGAINAALCMSGLIVVCIVVALGLSLFIHRDRRELLFMAFCFVAALTLVAFPVAWLRDVCTKGQIVFDCGPHPARLLFFFNCVIMAVLGVVACFSTTFLAPSYLRYGLAFAFASSLFNLILAFGRLQVTENGIWQYWGLLRWREVASWHWAKDNTLLLTATGRFAFLRRGALPVPPQCRDAVDDLLSRYCPVQGSNN